MDLDKKIGIKENLIAEVGEQKAFLRLYSVQLWP